MQVFRIWACPSCVRSGYSFQVLAKLFMKINFIRCGLSTTIPHAKKYFATETQRHSFISVVQIFSAKRISKKNVTKAQ